MASGLAEMGEWSWWAEGGRAGVGTVVVFVLAFVALMIPVGRRAHRVVHPVDVLVHESGHALAAAVLGGRVHGIRVNASGGGSADVAVPDSVRLWLVALAGYPAGACAGSALLAVAAAADYPRLAVGVMLLVSVVLLALSRSVFTVVVWVVVVASSLVMLAWVPPVGVQYVLAAVGGVLAGESAAHVGALWRQYRPCRGVCDGTQDWEVLPGPPMLWLSLFAAVTRVVPVASVAALVARVVGL